MQSNHNDTILIWGAGAIGGTLGAYFARAGEDVLLVDIVQAHVEAINRDGLVIEGPVEAFTQRLRAVTPEQVEGRFRRVGRVRAARLAEPRVWSTARGDELRGEADDWWVRADEELEREGRSVTPEAFDA